MAYVDRYGTCVVDKWRGETGRFIPRGKLRDMVE